MQIKIREDARARYYKEFTGRQIPNREWGGILEAIQGKTIEVETKYLFKDQFNTVSIPDVKGAERGLRISSDLVECVINDERIGKSRCDWCGTVFKTKMFCPKCGRSGYIERLWV